MNPPLTEKLSKNQPASVWIKDFIDSTNPKFKGKTKKERISMALGAYYAAQKNESCDDSSPFKPNDDSIEYDQEQLAAGIQIEMEHTDDKEIATIIAKHHLAEDPEYYIKLVSCVEKGIKEAKIPSYKYDVVIAKLKDGIWDSSYDVKRGKHLEVTDNNTKKTITIFVEDYGAGFEGTNALRDKYVKDTPGQRIQQFKTTMKQKTYQEFEAQHKKMYPTHGAEEIKKAWETYSKYMDKTKVVASVVLWNDKTIKKSFTTQSAAEAWVKKMQDDEDVRGYEMYAESAELEEALEFLENPDNFKMDEAQNLVSKGIYTLDGKKIDGARSSKLFLQGLDADGFLHNLSWKEWSELNLKDTSSDNAKKQFIDRLAKQIKMFNKRIDLNTWLKGGNRSFIDTVNYIFKLDPNIKYSKASGLKEDAAQDEMDEAVMPKEISQIKTKFDMELIPQSKWAKTYQTNARKVKQLYGIPKGNGQYNDVYFVIYDDENKPYGVVDIEGTTMYAKFSDAKAGLKFALNSMSEAYGESWVVLHNTKREITPFKTRKGAMDYAAKSGGVVYSGEYYHVHQDDTKSGKLVKGKEDALQEAINIREGTMKELEKQIAELEKAIKDYPKGYSTKGKNSPDSWHDRLAKLKAMRGDLIGKRIKEDAVQEAIDINNYMATSEKSQFGGYRPKVVGKSGKVLYLGQASYNTPFEAKDHAEDYLKQLARGVSEPRVPSRGTYGIKEEKEHYDSWIIKPRDGGQQVKVKAPDETSAIEIALGRKPSQNEIDFFNFHYILIQEKTNVSTLRHMKIVELATKCTDSNLVKEYVEQQYKPQTSALEIKESFRSFVANK